MLCALFAPRLITARITTGTDTRPAKRYDQFAAWFMMGSIASNMKSIRDGTQWAASR